MKMNLSKEQISEFQALYEHHFGKKISKEEVLKKANLLIRLINQVYKPISNEN